MVNFKNLNKAKTNNLKTNKKKIKIMLNKLGK